MRWTKEGRIGSHWSKLVRVYTSLDGAPFSLFLNTETGEPLIGETNVPTRRVTYKELYVIVADLVSALLEIGLKPGDRVASYSSNCIVREHATISLRNATVMRLTGKCGCLPSNFCNRRNMGQRCRRFRSRGST